MERAGLREHTLRDIRGVQWTPAWGEQRITGMIESRPDWCISRQRTWGVPIPLFVHKETRRAAPAHAGADRGGGGARGAGRDRRLVRARAARAARGRTPAHYDKVTDVMDVWADSGLSFECVGAERPEVAAPVELYLEGSDQHRGWFHSSLLMSEALYERAPYRGVLTHGFTVDEKGRKMSKSLGNVIAPQKVMSTLGADVLRLWVSATDYANEIAVSDEILRRMADSYRRMRNTLRFLLGNLHGFDPARHQLPAGGAAGARPLGARARPRSAGGGSRGVSQLLLSPDLPEGAQLLQRGSRRLLPGCDQGPHVHPACGAAPRAARRRPPCSTSPRAWCAGSRPSCRSRRKRCGAICRASGASRYSTRPGMRCRSCPPRRSTGRR